MSFCPACEIEFDGYYTGRVCPDCGNPAVLPVPYMDEWTRVGYRSQHQHCQQPWETKA